MIRIFLRRAQPDFSKVFLRYSLVLETAVNEVFSNHFFVICSLFEEFKELGVVLIIDIALKEVQNTLEASYSELS